MTLEVVVRNCVRAVEDVGSLVLVHTMPGAASLVGAAIDGCALSEVRATLAGMDLVVVVMDVETPTPIAAAVATSLSDRFQSGQEDRVGVGVVDASAWITDIDAVGSLVIVQTGPGAASLTRSAIDLELLPNSRGTIAGDDVVLIVTTVSEATDSAISVALTISQLRAEGVSLEGSGWIEDVEAIGSLVLVHTAPGAASVVAASIDGAMFPPVRGTIADEDVVLIVTDVANTDEAAQDFRLQLFPLEPGDARLRS